MGYSIQYSISGGTPSYIVRLRKITTETVALQINASDGTYYFNNIEGGYYFIEGIDSLGCQILSEHVFIAQTTTTTTTSTTLPPTTTTTSTTIAPTTTTTSSTTTTTSTSTSTTTTTTIAPITTTSTSTTTTTTTTTFLGPTTKFNNNAYSVIETSTNRYLVGGFFTSYDGTTANYIIQLYNNGSIDTSFVYGTGFNQVVYKIILTSDGKYLIGGNFTTYNGISANYIIKLNTDGSVDTSFDYGTGFNGAVVEIIETSDGKYLIGGAFTTYNGISAKGIIKLNTDGSKDTSFDYGTGFNLASLSTAFVNTIIETSGKYLIGGFFSFYYNGGISASNIIRLNTDGSKDTSFNYGTGLDGSILKIIETSDNKYLIGGTFSGYNYISQHYLIRLNNDGTFDSSLFPLIGNFVITFVETATGKYLIGGEFNSGIIQLNTNGTTDTSFNGYFDSAVHTVYDIIKTSDGKYVVIGSFTDYNFVTPGNRIFKLDTDGTVIW